MKTLRLIVSMRLAFFPLVFNLSIAQEVEVNNNESSSWTEGEGSYAQIDNFNTQDFSQQTEWQVNPENDNDIVPIYERGYGEAEGIFSNEEEKILSSSDSPCLAGQASFQKGAQELNTQDSSQQTEWQALPNLVISEVYRLWSTEWIEITNLSQSEFDGTLTFLGANNKWNVLYTDVKIQWYESIILSSVDDVWMMNWDINTFYPNKITLTDWNEISIELQYSWDIIDSFEVAENIVSKQATYYKNRKPRPSFQKFFNDWREIQITSETDLYNISWFIANPWKIVVQSWNPREWVWPSYDSWNGDDSWNTDEPWSWDNPWEWESNIPWSWGNSWNENLTWWSSDFNLIISEVYYDDEDEWIEIYNIWTWDFYWNLILSWNIYWKNQTSFTYQNIQIPANDFIIFADSDEMFQNIKVQLNGQIYPEFSIPDDQEIQISLIFSWEKIDLFYAHKYRVDKRNGFGVSFHKIVDLNGAIVTWSLSNDDANLSEWTENSANPWVLYTSAENIIDYAIDPNASSSEPEEISDTVDCSSVEDDVITISEVFRWWDRYDPYVEFLIHEDIEREYDSLLLSWGLLAQPLTIDLDEETETYDREKLQKNTRLILTTKAWALTEAGLITIVLHPDLKFNSTAWELELYGIDGQSRQLLDIVKIENWSPEKSTYTAGSNHRCWIIMDNVMDFSPGFDESALKYFSTTSKYNERIVEKVKYVGWWGGCSCPSKEELCWIISWNAVQTGGNILTWSQVDSLAEASEWQTWSQEVLSPSDSSFQKGAQIKIVSLEPKSPESITLQSFLPYDIDFKNHNYYIKTSTATTKKYIDGILYSNTIDTFTKNFWFVDGGACVYLYSWDNQLDSYCYSTQKQQTEKEKSDQNTDSFNPSDYQISIIHIDYDPEWSDGWNETITIQSKSSQPLDLSKIKMKVNATNKKLTWILEPYSTLTLKWSFWFPNSTKDNSDVVVILFYDNHIFSTYTYNPNKPKVEIPQWAVKVYSVIDGDTFRYRKEDWTLQSVRLLWVDAPESNTARYRTTECFWKEAKNYLANLIKNQYVTLEFDETAASSDAYGRMLAYVYLDWKLVNETLISEWYAKEYTYKTSYTQQSAFKQAEENAKKAEKWLWSASTCGKSIEEEPDAWGIDYEKLSIKISNVIYDPDGTDSGNETVQLSVDNSQISAVSSIDFSDDFSLTIFPRSEYSTWTTKTKKLTEFWIFNFSSSPEITLKWNFWLPNNRATCISLNQWSYTFDTRCYNPNGSLSEEELVLSWQVSTSFPDVKIQSIVPNPSWKDSWKEEITLLWSPSENFQNMLDLSPDFSLLINWKTKKKLVWSLTPNQKITIKWSFSFPNSASCVSLLYKWEELDKFCYSKASDGVKFNSNNTSVREISAEELAIVKKITLVRQWDKLCISYNKTKFSCKSIPNSTTEKDKKLLSMQNNYISELEKYLKNNYSMMYYNSQLKEYFDLYSDAKKAIKAWSGEFTRNDSNISVTNISSLFSDEYEQDAKDYFVMQIHWILPETLSLALLQAEDEYTQKLVEKSDLGFLSLVE